MQTETHKSRQRRDLLIKNTRVATYGYTVPLISFFVIKWIGIAQYSYSNLLLLGLWIYATRLISHVIIRRWPLITTQFAQGVTICELVNWIFIYWYLISFLDQFRLTALFCAFLGIIFLFTSAGYIAAFVTSLATFTTYVAVAYYQITFGNQSGIFAIELKQIIYNLLSNAVKFTQNGGEIRVIAQKANGNAGQFTEVESPIFENFIEIAVHDTGTGIEAEDLERIFDPFEQAENSASKKYQGTGLGLALTRSLVELHGGKIWAQSRGEGQGSSFHIIIPTQSQSLA